MRQSIETAPRDRKTVIIEDRLAGTSDFAHWSPERRRWVRENGDLSTITPTHWYPIPLNQHISNDEEGDFVAEEDQTAFDHLIEYPVSGTLPQLGMGRRGFIAFAIAALLVAATLIGLYFEVVASETRYAHLEDIYRIVV